MGRALRTAAFVVGAAAAIVATAGALAPLATATALGSVGITASASALAAGLGLASAALSVAGTVIAGVPKGSVGGNPTKFKIDKDGGIPIIFGRTARWGQLIPAGASP